MKTTLLILLSMLTVPVFGQVIYQCPDEVRNFIYQQVECDNGTEINMGVISKKVAPLYAKYSTLKSIIRSLLKEPRLEELSPPDIQNYIQKRIDISNIDNIQARDLKIRKSTTGRVLDLVYQDEKEIFEGTGLFVVLKVNEEIPLIPKGK